jgi:hypothetical protein
MLHEMASSRWSHKQENALENHAIHFFAGATAGNRALFSLLSVRFVSSFFFLIFFSISTLLYQGYWRP